MGSAFIGDGNFLKPNSSFENLGGNLRFDVKAAGADFQVSQDAGFKYLIACFHISNFAKKEEPGQVGEATISQVVDAYLVVSVDKPATVNNIGFVFHNRH